MNSDELELYTFTDKTMGNRRWDQCSAPSIISVRYGLIIIITKTPNLKQHCIVQASHNTKYLDMDTPTLQMSLSTAE